jgi:hypothetical protein
VDEEKDLTALRLEIPVMNQCERTILNGLFPNGEIYTSTGKGNAASLCMIAQKDIVP